MSNISKNVKLLSVKLDGGGVCDVRDVTLFTQTTLDCLFVCIFDVMVNILVAALFPIK